MSDTDEVRYPEVTVRLIGENGNAMYIIARVRQALQRAQVPRREIQEFTEDAMSGDYNHVLLTCMRWVEVE